MTVIAPCDVESKLGYLFKKGPLTEEFGWTEQDELVILSVPGASCTLSVPFGAHVTCWSQQGKPRLWMSSLSARGASGPIRGGIPIAFPQFADNGTLSLHGFARTQPWQIISLSAADDTSSVTLRLADSEATRAVWPHRFELTYTVTLTASTLRMELGVKNVDSASFNFGGCLHTYFRVGDIRQCTLRGLCGATYIDKVDGMKEKHEEGVLLVVPEASAASAGFVDRIYRQSGGTYELADASTNVRYIICNSDSWTDTVVFNPWEMGKQGDKGPDFDDDGYNHLLCVEPTIDRKVTLDPGEEFKGSQHIEVSAL